MDSHTGPAPRLAVRPTSHFLERLRERAPGAWTKESELQGELERARWYPAPGAHGAYYAVTRVKGEPLVLVVAVEEGLATLVTVYRPARNWDERVLGTIGLPFALIAAVAA